MTDGSFAETDAVLDPDARDPEAPVADAVEQATPVSAAQWDREPYQGGSEANEWDALEQSRVIDVEDEY